MPDEVLHWFGVDGMCDMGGCPNEADWLVAEALDRHDRRHGFPPMARFFCEAHVRTVPMATREEIAVAAGFHDDPDYPSAGHVKAWQLLAACWPLPLRVNYGASAVGREP